ncbi:hypothetical protein, partial [Acetobacterium wieringae]|uniref:hypothetical protein n=1 Tax=Acetobacterium wieringae TaxID=52694 RepID=UPI0026F12891
MVGQSWKRSDAYKIDYLNALPEEIPPSEFYTIIKKNKRLGIYTSSVATFPLSQSQMYYPECGILLFDKTGCLLQLYGNKEFLS